MPILETVKRFSVLAGLSFVLLALLLPARASADMLPVVVQVQAPDGTHVQVSGEGAFELSAERPLRARTVGDRRGRPARLHRPFAPRRARDGRPPRDPGERIRRRRCVGSRAVEGRKPQGLPNQVIPLKDGGYVVSLQESLDGRQRKLAGLFVHLGAKTGRLPAGTELLVGVPAEVNSGVGYTYPLGQPGEIIGCPFVPGSTHSAFVAPDNLASDNAVDIAVPLGTPVLAVTAGVIGPQIGPLDSMDPRMAGLRVHLNAPGVQFYYAHLSEIDVIPGQFVQAGQQLGLSGSANGAAHLHFAQDVGNPAETVGALGACPFYQSYSEPWG